MLRKIVVALSVLMVTLFYTGCGKKEIEIPSGLQGKLYTQANMWEEKSRIYSTNYNRGILIPVNSEIKIDSMTNKTIVFTVVKTSQQITLINVQKHTKLPSAKLAEQVFGTKPVNLDAFSKSAQSAIKAGQVKQGMTKDEVLVARGYPPAVLTHSLKSNSWMYQKNRFGKMRIDFKGNKVSKVIN
jgi:hypothetical protein